MGHKYSQDFSCATCDEKTGSLIPWGGGSRTQGQGEPSPPNGAAASVGREGHTVAGTGRWWTTLGEKGVSWNTRWESAGK